MSVVFVVLPLALLIVGAAVWAFVRASLSGQFDDLETPALRMLHDDAPNRYSGTSQVPESRSGRPRDGVL
jgi:cbb3-type cytochrome oxidase maturation protein